MKQSLSAFFSRMRGSGKCAPRHSLSWIFWSWVGSFLGILLVGSVNKLFDITATDNIFLIGSFGASAVLIYGTPHVPYAQPRNLIGGHFISALTGVAVVQFLPIPIEFQAALAVSLAIVFMHLTRTIHPPGGASSLIAVIGSAKVHALGFSYVFAPVLSGALLMLVVALVVNNIRHDEERHYPRCWWQIQVVDMRFGIDLGGTKIEIIALDDTGQEQYRQRVNTPQGNYKQTLQAIVDLISSARQAVAPAEYTVGIGIPGAMSLKTGRVKNTNSVWLIGEPLKDDLQQRLGQEVRINNDANCLTVSEATDGAAASAPVVFGVIIGTGTGGGIAIKQQVITGVNAIAGEWGHNPMPWKDDTEGPVQCYCGKQDCIETFLSGPGMLKRFIARGGQADSPAAIVEQAETGSELAEAFMQDYELWRANGLAGVINILDPDVIVLSGSLSNIERLYQNVPPLWQYSVFSDQVSTRLVKARYGDSSGVRGAAWLWPLL